MKKESNQEIADKVFKDNTAIDQVHVCGGFAFVSLNSANLHKNTAGIKGLKVATFKRPEAIKAPEDKPTTPVKLDKLKLAELQAVATKAFIRFDEKATKAELIDLINESKTAV